MRRAQSVRHHTRPSIALAADDLGMLREGSESDEDVLRRQLIDKDRECDKLNTLVQTLQAQLAQRPPLEEVQALQKEYKNLELILSGTQRENERCMGELDRVKQREKLLERKLCDLVGENWQSSLDIPPAPISTNALLSSSLAPLRSAGHQRSHTISSSPLPVTTLSGIQANSRQTPSPSIRAGKPGKGGYYNHDNGSSASQEHVRDSLLEASPITRRRERRRRSFDDDERDRDDSDMDGAEGEDGDSEAAAAREEEKEKQRALMFSHIEQVKLLVLGMEQRLQTREEELKKTVERAEREGGRFEVLRREMDTSVSVA